MRKSALALDIALHEIDQFVFNIPKKRDVCVDITLHCVRHECVYTDCISING